MAETPKHARGTPSKVRMPSISRKSRDSSKEDDQLFPEPAVLAKQLRDEGWPVPGFLLYPGDPRHVRPLVALSVLTNMLQAAGEQVEPYVYYPPKDPRHVPPYVAALDRQRKLWALQNLHPHPKSLVNRKIRNTLRVIWTPFQYLIGAILSLSSIVIVFRAIQQNKYEVNLPPVGMGIVVVVLLIVIAYSEGYHVTIITLEKADSRVFQLSHPRAFRAHKVANKDAECFVVGRQVLLTFIVFVFATVTDFSKAHFDDDWWIFPAKLMSGVTKTGVGCSLIVLAFGQLLPQLIATAYPIHHMNLPGGILLVWLMLLFDRIGIANVGFWGAYLWRKWRGIMVNEEFGVGGHVVFGVDEDGQAKATPAVVDEDQAGASETVTTVPAPGKGGKVKEEKNAGAQIGEEASGEIHKRVRNDPIEIGKLLFSLGIMLATVALALRHIILGEGGFDAPWPVLIAIHIVLLVGMLYLEGMNLCVLALEKVPNEHVRVINPGAVKAHKLIIGDNGNNVKRFLLGRQFCVVWMDFLIHQIGGIYSVAITVFLSQVMSQIIAATNPCYWMALPGARFMLLLSLGLERLGVCHFGWFLGHLFTWLGETTGILKPEPFSVGKKVTISGLGNSHEDEMLIAQFRPQPAPTAPTKLPSQSSNESSPV